MKNIKKLNVVLALALCLVQWSCKGFLEIDPPSNSLVPATVFKSDEVATSAVLGIYSSMAASGYGSGDSGSISTICGLSADEYIAYSTVLIPFNINQVPADNSVLANLWLSVYQRIYASNSVLEGLSESKVLSPSVAAGLRGEALFTRAFNYFYLVNLFGAVPLHLTTDQRLNAIASRKPVGEVYAQLVADLQEAETLLADAYVGGERSRPNKAAARALLARVYLYIGDFKNAEVYASKVIDMTSVYALVGLNNIFLKNSQEAIWQLMPPAGANTNEGNLLILTATPIQVSLSANLAVNGFEVGDQRKVNWVRSFVNATGTYYYPFKYKVKSSTTVTEHSMVLRLAELYLIRAEARVNLDNLAGGLSDLNVIRVRAGLSGLGLTLNKSQLLSAIQGERRVELLGEWGHRWLDLKRTGTATLVLAPIKANWQATDVLYPIAKDEVNRNQNITQNEGY
ncbi:RagB/SusD family nutrient uptake outer membrane protein [Pedobacter frigiditerrae]|nr:RagB/SusD family nutrient uptake outer membrane protein [Pedobacter frigiditerrae]